MMRGRRSLRDSIDNSQPPSPSGSEDEDSGSKSPSSNGLVDARSPSLRGGKSNSSTSLRKSDKHDEMVGVES